MVTGIVLAALIVAAGTLHVMGRAGPWVLAAISLLWLRVNHRVEGAVLWRITEDHGLTAADLAAFAGLGLAVWALWRMRRRARTSEDERVER